MKLMLGFLMLLTVATKSQGFKIEYEVRFNDLYDRGRSDRHHMGLLFIGDHGTRYFTVEKEKYKPRSDHDIMLMPDTANQVYMDLERGIMVSQESDFKGKNFFVSDSLHSMLWTITSEEKKIDSLECIKAVCDFRGRSYVAWFCPAIPIPYGPWKMGGLPGLIVDLFDTEENLLIKLKSVSRQEVKVEIPTYIKYTQEEYISQVRQFLKRLQESARATETGNCISCQQKSVIKFYTWEKILQ